MSDELRLVVAALASLTAALALTPVAMRVAARFGCMDRPRGYRVHEAATPYLGGAALVTAVLIGSLALGGALERFWPILLCTIAMCAIGTVDDRLNVRPLHRILAEVAAAGLLTATGTGWDFLPTAAENFALTALWILAFTNAFNLTDNMDGSAATIGATSAAGVGALALVQGDVGLAVLMTALIGACLGFLRYNLTRTGPARIFLGDGGSMPLGFLLAAAATRLPGHDDIGWPVLLGAAMLLGIPALDTMLVVFSRTRRGVALTTGGHDHLTHRLRTRLRSARAVALVLATAQALVACAAIVAFELGRVTVVASAFATVVLGLVVVAILDSPGWAPAPLLRQPGVRSS